MSSFSGSCQIDLQCGCTIWHSQQAAGVPVAPNLHQHLMVSVLLIFIILVNVPWNTVSLICILLVINEVAQLFIYPLVIRRSHIVKGTFTRFCLFFCWVACPFLTLDINLFLLYTLQISSPFLQFAFSFSCCLLVKWCFQVSIMVQFANLCFMGRACPVPYRIVITFKKGNLLCV